MTCTLRNHRAPELHFFPLYAGTPLLLPVKSIRNVESCAKIISITTTSVQLQVQTNNPNAYDILVAFLQTHLRKSQIHLHACEDSTQQSHSIDVDTHTQRHVRPETWPETVSRKFGGLLSHLNACCERRQTCEDSFMELEERDAIFQLPSGLSVEPESPGRFY